MGIKILEGERLSRVWDRIFLRQTFRLFKFSLKNRYRNTWAGFVWVLLQPILQFGVQAFAFKFIVKIEQENYLIFLLSGLLPWIFITSSIEMSATSFIHQAHVFRSIVISPVSFIVSQVLDNFVVLVIGLAVGLLCFFLFFGETVVARDELSRLASPALILAALFPLIVFTTGVSVTFATFQVFFRDLRFVLSFGLQSLYFITPVLFPVRFVPEAYRWVLDLNPVHHMIRPFREALFGTFQEFAMAYAASWMVALLAATLGWGVWRMRGNEVILRV